AGLIGAGLVGPIAVDSAPSAAAQVVDPLTVYGNLDQCANGGVGQTVQPCTGAAWVNGNLNGQKAHYLEGDSVPYRLLGSNLSSVGTHTIVIQWDTTTGGKHALDYLTSFNRTESTAN